MNIKDVNFGILGMARSGLAAAYKIKELGGHPFISEKKPEKDIDDPHKIRADFDCEFGGHSDRLLDCDIIIISPGIPLDIPILIRAKEKKIKLISEIEFGYLIKHPESKIIAITGSNGKSTTVSLIHHILQTAGFNSILAGNIGTAFTSCKIEKAGIDVIVLELSSFQLELINKFRPDVAVILNITPDHLDRYNSMEEYALTKFNIFKNQKEDNLAILNYNDEYCKKFDKKISAVKKYFSLDFITDIFYNGNSIIFGDNIISIQRSSIKGPHNTANIMASILAVSPFKIRNEIIEKALSSFVSLPHRLEPVAIINGIKFINDSKATNTDSVKYALQSFEEPIRIIMGGAGKGEDYSVLNPYLKKHAKKIYLIGDARYKMKKAFENIVDIELFDDFEKSIIAAFSEAEKGDSIVLSPACTSYDMFNNFEERGNKFKQIVLGLGK
ncbi:MAG: UDP-N-acetylmuramoyl-L-alanine--D-glutamate ligase [Candidatus Cloacimonetes bacterium]|nr:UDP-N-acetylmuramoyl-L-alanine--D-glutamate ligase [Candidatus Cloacimonadota bacterium]